MQKPFQYNMVIFTSKYLYLQHFQINDTNIQKSLEISEYLSR